MSIKENKINIAHLRIAMNLADIPVNDAAVETFLMCLELVKKKGGKGSLKDACKIKATIEEKYKGTEIIHPKTIIDGITKEKNKTIDDQLYFLKKKTGQILDIQQLAQMLISRGELRPAVVRSIASDIVNICTD